uniref:PCRF domain-containing protein n=1 Tax=Macrostomum lignano TaxID=282301 RepID=A0A1I8JKQ7_9PLAT
MLQPFPDQEFVDACQQLEVENTDGFEFFTESHDVRIFRQYNSTSGLYKYKIYGFLHGAAPELCAQVYRDLDYRRTWDSYVNELKVLLQEGDDREYYDDPRGSIPTMLINWGAKTGVPGFLSMMQKAVNQRQQQNVQKKKQKKAGKLAELVLKRKAVELLSTSSITSTSSPTAAAALGAQCGRLLLSRIPLRCHRCLHSLPDSLRPKFDARIGRLSAEFDALTARIAQAANAAAASDGAAPAAAKIESDSAKWRQLKPLADKIDDLLLLRQLAAETRQLISSLNGVDGDLEDGDGEDGELVDMAKQENCDRDRAIAGLEVEIAEMLLPPRSLPSDCSVLLEVKPGVGGLEAMLFAAELFHMYTAYAQYKGWHFDIVEEARADIGGLRSGALEISNGVGIFDELKYETGTHRVQRVPQTGDVIHTSTATVFVMPKPEDAAADFELNPADIEIQVHKSSGPGGQGVNKHMSAVRLLHKPTGIRVDCQVERTQHQNMVIANRMLRERVLRLRLEALADEERAARAVQSQRDRSDRIRTYNYQQGRITDHRGRLTLSPVDMRVFIDQPGQQLGGIIQALKDREELALLEQTLTADSASGAGDSAGDAQAKQQRSKLNNTPVRDESVV